MPLRQIKESYPSYMSRVLYTTTTTTTSLFSFLYASDSIVVPYILNTLWLVSDIAMINQNILIFSAIAIGTLLLFASVPSTQFAFAHQRQLFTIGDKDYLFVVDL